MAHLVFPEEHHLAAMMPWLIALGQETIEDFKDFPDIPSHQWVVALDDEMQEVIGAAYYENFRKSSEVHVSVNPEYLKTGLSRQLMLALLKIVFKAERKQYVIGKINRGLLAARIFARSFGAYQSHLERGKIVYKLPREAIKDLI